MTNHQNFDNIALAYTVARLVKLNQFDHAAKLFDFYENTLNLFERINNPHNVCQMLLGLAIMKDHTESRWSKLMDRIKSTKFENDRSCNNVHFVKSAIVFYTLIKKESPELYQSVLKDAPLEHFIYKFENKFKNESVSSFSHSIIGSIIKHLGYEVVNEHRVGIKDYDMYIPQKNLLIEFNGPTHYLNGTNTPTGSDLYTYRLLKDSKYDLLHLPYHEVMAFDEFKHTIFYSHDDFRDDAHTESDEIKNLEDYIKYKLDNIDQFKYKF